ncbi:hypothetical protein [Streptomyces sp. AP-93]|uniref:hypothetical protein n=1 Tax=Streptomyces sp. AP-93 TaxID=2929048 RepID=UPI001FAEA3FE|nr:hypothetical protein [Streptomyces sp. AP-93]MCJ0871479.1 hypothetical protein [Streptomyces sp. AP-93]
MPLTQDPGSALDAPGQPDPATPPTTPATALAAASAHAPSPTAEGGDHGVPSLVGGIAPTVGAAPVQLIRSAE